MDTLLERNELLESAVLTDYGLVSIIMPNYNSDMYIKKTIDSVLAQTYKNWELIIVDDCSTDNSLKIVNSFNDARIKIIKNEVNSGAAVSRNNALRVAEGKWIAFLDSDDLWTSEKLEKQISFMVDDDLLFSYTDYDVVDENDKITSTFRPSFDICTYKDILKHNHIGV